VLDAATTAAEVLKKSRLLSIATPVQRSFFLSHGAPTALAPSQRDGKARPSNRHLQCWYSSWSIRKHLFDVKRQ